MENSTRSGFRVNSEYQPTGDQPRAIEQLASGLDAGLKGQTLLGVAESGRRTRWRGSSSRQAGPCEDTFIEKDAQVNVDVSRGPDISLGVICLRYATIQRSEKEGSR